jgi:hypothetical protein
MWLGGVVPLGFECVDHRLIANEAETKTVCEIFTQYVKPGCVSKLKKFLDHSEIRSKIRTSKAGRCRVVQRFPEALCAGFWRPRRQPVKSVHVWRPRRSAFGELVMMDSSPYRWLDERGPACHLIALIDDATSRAWGRLAEHDSTEGSLRTLRGWLDRQWRPLALYTDKNSLFVTSRHPEREERLRDTLARTQFDRAPAEMNIEWIAAHPPQAKGRIARLFGTLQDRLVKQMRWAEINTLEAANRFLKITNWPSWLERFAVQPAQGRDAHRRLERAHRLEQILSVRVARTVTWKA